MEMNTADVQARPSEELEPVLISALNHYAFCPRRCALIHVDGLHGENAYLLEGLELHESIDTPGVENRPGVRVVRALPVFSRRLGLVGKADIVEFHDAGGKTGSASLSQRVRNPKSASWIPYPVDYKRGPKRRWDNDDIQLCAQALCLEEMLGIAVPEGAIFHARSKRRRVVAFTAELRRQTEAAIVGVRELVGWGQLPPAAVHPRCDGCSLRDACLPEITSQPDSVADIRRRLLRIEGDEP